MPYRRYYPSPLNWEALEPDTDPVAELQHVWQHAWEGGGTADEAREAVEGAIRVEPITRRLTARQAEAEAARYWDRFWSVR